MASTAQYEVVAVLKNGCIQRAHSTDWDRAKDTYNNIPTTDCLYKVLWRSVDHSPLDPTVVKSWPMR